MPDIQVGDRVCLKSGGPTMTVEWIDPSQGVSCKWFDEIGTIQTQVFADPAMLEKI